MPDLTVSATIDAFMASNDAASARSNLGLGPLATASSVTAAQVSDFNSAARAQVEAELVAGTNVTITPAGSGATRQLTVAAPNVATSAELDLLDFDLQTQIDLRARRTFVNLPALTASIVNDAPVSTPIVVDAVTVPTTAGSIHYQIQLTSSAGIRYSRRIAVWLSGSVASSEADVVTLGASITGATWSLAYVGNEVRLILTVTTNEYFGVKVVRTLLE